MICFVLLLQGIGINQNFRQLLGSNLPGSYWAEGPQGHTSRSGLNHFFFNPVSLSSLPAVVSCWHRLCSSGSISKRHRLQGCGSRCMGLVNHSGGIAVKCLVEESVLQFLKYREIKLQKISAFLKPEWWWRELEE